jgi:hypothetical protein
MALRFKSAALSALIMALHGVSPVAHGEAPENGAPSGFFSEHKAMDTYATYRTYLESDSGAAGAENPEQVRKKLELSGRFLKSGLVSEDMLTDLFRIESRFAKDIERTVPDWKVEEVFKHEKMQDLGLNEADAAMLKSMIKSQLYLDAPVNVQKANDFRDMAVIEKQSESKDKNAPLPVEALRIKGRRGGDCLASGKDGECFVSVDEFNAYLPYADEQTGMSVAEARDFLLRFYAFQKLKSLKGREEAEDVDEQSIVQHVRDVQDYRRMRETLKGMGMGLPVMDKEALLAAYHKYYRAQFADRDSVVLQVLVASDSAYADSLYRRLGAPPEPALPWMAFNESALPPELVAPTDTFSEGDVSKPIKTASGFVLVRLAKVVRLPRVPFEKAQTRCIYLATRDKYAGLDSMLNANARKYYQKHPEEFRTPDTSAYRFWRVPGKTCASVREYAKDTTHIRPMAARGTELPRNVTEKIRAGSIPDSLRMQLVETRFGQMLVELVSVNKGGRKIPFAPARKGIVADLLKSRDAQAMPLVQAPSEDSAVAQEVLLTLGAGNLIYKSIIEETKDIPESEIDAAVKAGQVDVSDVDPKAPKAQFYAAARQKMEYGRVEKKQGEIQSQLNEVRFNTGLLTSN